MRKSILLCVLMWLMSCSQHYEEGAHPPPKPPPVQASAADKDGMNPAQASDAVVSGTIRLADGLDERIGSNAVLFVIARPAPVGGPPLAVKRLDISDFPLSYTLTQGDAMIEIDWSEIDALYVSAKIDADGRVGGSKTGDMEGIYPNNPVVPGAVDVDILISNDTNVEISDSKKMEQEKKKLAQTSEAAKTYTPEQLNRMISSGQPPAQGEVYDTQTHEVSFAECKVAVESVMSQFRGNYPVRTIVDTGIMYMVKAWANDGVITATCSQPDRKMVLTQSSYK